MSHSASPQDGDAQRPDRLDSWKEIAAYLGRSVRTVQRWEAQEGLPTHRHVHSILGTVCAYRSELDAWRNARSLLPVHLASILNSSDDAIVVTTLDDDIVSWNPAAERILGYCAEEVMGRSFLFLVPPDQLEETQHIRERIRRGERVDHYETVRAHKDGRRIDISLTLSPIRDPAGAIVSVCSIARDITERKRSQEELLRRQRRLELLHNISSRLIAEVSVEEIVARTLREMAEHFGSCRVAYSTVDPEGGLTVVHSQEPPGMPSLSGLRADLKVAPEYLAALQRHEPVTVRDVAADRRLEPLAAAMEAGGTRAMLDVPLHHSESLVGLLCVDSPVPRDWSEHEIATVTEVADCLSLAIRDARLRESYRRALDAFERDSAVMAALLDSVPALVVLMDAAGRIVRASGTCREVLCPGLEGKTFWQLLPTLEERESVKVLLERLPSLPSPAPWSGTWLGADGRPRQVAWSLTAFRDAQGSIEYVAATGTPLSEPCFSAAKPVPPSVEQHEHQQ